MPGRLETQRRGTGRRGARCAQGKWQKPEIEEMRIWRRRSVGFPLSVGRVLWRRRNVVLLFAQANDEEDESDRGCGTEEEDEENHADQQ